MVLEKLINTNTLFDTIIGGTITEFDIKSAGSTAIRELKGEEAYNKLMLLEKEKRNITIGLMMRDEKGLSQKVNELMLKYLNMFVEANKIKPSNLIYTTRDSIVIYNKIPTKTKFGNVEFRNKDGIFSSMYKINNFYLFFDSMTGTIICKGVKDEVVANSPFIHFLKRHLITIENCQKNGDRRLFDNLTNFRNSYLNSPNNNIYRSLMDENRYCLRAGEEVLFVDNEIEEDGVDGFMIGKDLNYVNFIIPIMRSVLING